ncbi:uncharacterized protein L3040_002121 [Drepanopeziza brunnea f. sp. 'multigermtubi']|uniref:uncharacterized protein n=1 Tax=Drepanopeziza brunnea f. sp. 'multigermtubi' TaxID=698441 RepID=UPI0023923969|nr:hypothetical protein L3040_002121 [Drepanopeziza brunnea f. sp. 'multigermtubi']
MAENPGRAGRGGGRLDASGPREVVFCHQCEHEWWRDQNGLACPRCEGEITEIVTTESDPRPEHYGQPPPVDGGWGGRHNPVEIDSDPEEADIEEHVTHGPGGSVMFSRTYRSTAPGPRFIATHIRRTGQDDNPDPIMRNFQDLIGSFMGPDFRPGPAGRSGVNTLFPQPPDFGSGFRGGNNGPGPAIVGGHYTFVNGNLVGGEPLQPRNADGPQQAGGPIDLATLLGGVFGQQNGPQNAAGMPPGLRGLFAAMINPVNARSGDAVYSQEALDQIISTLMEQQSTSNAPGPASPDAISSLPKKNLDEKELGPEGKGECSVCMDDVTFGTEVVVLPCSHWFHETCASAWLSEHNTCPICRKGIENSTAESASQFRRPSQSSPTTRNGARARRLSNNRPRLDRFNSSSTREARLDSIRNSGRLSPTNTGEPQNERGNGPDMGVPRWDADTGAPRFTWGHEFNQPPPPPPRRRGTDRSDMSETQRDSRRGYTNTAESRRSSNSANSTGGGNGGPMGWLRDRFGGGGRRD